LKEARLVAAREGITLRALVERALRNVVAESEQGGTFKLRDGSFKGEGLQPEFADASWNEIVRACFAGRSG
jgi:hypothetical protein